MKKPSTLLGLCEGNPLLTIKILVAESMVLTWCQAINRHHTDQHLSVSTSPEPFFLSMTARSKPMREDIAYVTSSAIGLFFCHWPRPWPGINRDNGSRSVYIKSLLTHWGRDKMAAIFQTTVSNGFSWMKMYEFRLKFHWSLFPRVQITIFQATSHYLNQWWLVYWRIYASLSLNELMLPSKSHMLASKLTSIYTVFGVKKFVHKNS